MDKFFNKGVQLMEEGKYEAAVASFIDHLKNQPNHALSYANIGNVFLILKDYERAVNFFKEAIKKDENLATAYYGLGNVYFELEDFEKARASFESGLKKGLNQGDLFYMLGMSYVHLGNDLGAMPYLQRATEINDVDLESHFQYGLALARLQYIDEATAVFNKIIEKDAKHSDALYNLGVACLLKDEIQLAESYFKKAISAQEDHLLAHNGLRLIEQLKSEG